MRSEQFEFASAQRGVMAVLTWQRYSVVLTEPQSLLAMAQADVLGPGAKAEAEAFGPIEVVVPPRPTPWVPAETTCAVGGCGWPVDPCPFHPKAKRKVLAPIYESGEDLRDEALERVERNADPAWLAAARLVQDGLASTGDEFTSDDIWAALDRQGLPRPHEPRVMGAITGGASRAGLIAYAGRHVPSRDPVRHGRPIPVWRGVRP